MTISVDHDTIIEVAPTSAVVGLTCRKRGSDGLFHDVQNISIPGSELAEVIAALQAEAE